MGLFKRKYLVESYCDNRRCWNKIGTFNSHKKATECLNRQRDKKMLSRIYDRKNKIYLY